MSKITNILFTVIYSSYTNTIVLYKSMMLNYCILIWLITISKKCCHLIFLCKESILLFLIYVKLIALCLRPKRQISAAEFVVSF